MKADEFVSIARSWLGVPFKHQGRSRHGVDCAGLLEVLLESAAILPEDYSAPRSYGRRPNGELRKIVERYCRRSAGPAIAGSIVLVVWPRETEPGHVALCTGPNIIHAYARVGRVVENGYRGPWIRNTHSVWLAPGISYV